MPVGLYPPQLPGEPAPGRQSTVRNGNEVTIVAPNALVEPYKSLEYKLLGAKRLLTLSKHEFRPGEEGRSWVVSVKTTIPTPVVSRIAPVVLQVSYGQGGTSQTFICDAEGTLVLPSDDVTIQVGWLSQLQANANTYDYADEATISAVAVRGTSTPPTMPRLSVDYDDSLGSSVEVRIPPFAHYWTAYPNEIVTAGAEPFASLYAYGAATIVENILPEVAASMARMHQYRALPGLCQSLILLTTPPNFSRGRVEFQLSL